MKNLMKQMMETMIVIDSNLITIATGKIGNNYEQT